MNVLQKIHVYEGAFVLTLDSEKTLDEVAALIGLSGSTATSCKIGVQAVHGFHVYGITLHPLQERDGSWTCRINTDEFDDPLTLEGLAHYPWDPAVIEIDIQGAARAYPNADKSGWLPEHCDEDFHHDHEDLIRAVINTYFDDEIQALTLDCLTKAGTLARRSSDSFAGSQELAARLKLYNLMIVKGHVVDCALKMVRSRYIGFYHHYPNTSHYRDTVSACLDKAIALNKFTQSAVYLSVSSELDRISKTLRAKHRYERRWEMAARLERERKAREAGG